MQVTLTLTPKNCCAKRLPAIPDARTGLPLTDELVERAVTLTQDYKLRAADAVHLATALDLKHSVAGVNESVVVIASDQQLLEAARLAGLTVEDPVVAASH